MNAYTDSDLLQHYLSGDRSAFAELARRHVSWVYSAARRRCGDDHLAEDVTQAVFIALAQRPPRHWTLSSVSPWLFGVLIRTCRAALRAQDTRRRHEHEAAKMRTEAIESPVHADWSAISVHLEELVCKLRSNEREIILMRFYEQKSFQEIAELIGITEEAARKRVSRSVDSLRGMLSRRGVSMPAATLGATLLKDVVSPAPAAIATVAGQAAAGSGSAMALSISKGAVAMFAASTTKIAAAVGLVLFLLAASAAIHGRPPVAQAPATGPNVVAAAEAPLPVPQTVEEATAQMNMLYGLANGEVIRIVPPPFPAARTVWLGSVKNPPITPPDVGFMAVPWSPAGLAARPNIYGNPGIRMSTLRLALGFEWYEIEGLNQVLWRPPDGDLVARTGATREQKIDAFASLLRRVTGKPMTIRSERRTRTCIVVSGDKQASMRRPDGYAVWVMNKPPDDAIKNQSSERNLPSGFALAGSQFDYVGELLDTPIFRDPPADPIVHRPPPNVYLVAPDVHLNRDDPQYLNQLQAIAGVVQDQVGGEWRIEQRPIETFVLDPAPTRHPSQDVVEAFIDAAARGDQVAAARLTATGGSARIGDISELIKATGTIPLIEIWADDAVACILSEQFRDPMQRQSRIKFHLRNEAGQWRLERIEFSRTISREQFLEQHPKSGTMNPFPPGKAVAR